MLGIISEGGAELVKVKVGIVKMIRPTGGIAVGRAGLTHFQGFYTKASGEHAPPRR